MAKKKNVKRAVREIVERINQKLVVERINQKLAAKGQILIKATLRMKKLDYGDYYTLDLSGNVMDTHIDPKELARKLRVLKIRPKS